MAILTKHEAVEAAPPEEYYAERLYEEDTFPIAWVLRKVFAQIKFTQAHAEALKELAGKGVVVYALRQRSQLNTLIIRQLAAATGIPRPVYAHGTNMALWQPFPTSLKSLIGTLLRPLLRKSIPDPCTTGYLRRITEQGASSIIHLGKTEAIEDTRSDDGIRQLLQAQRTMDRPIYLVPQLVTYGRRRDREQENLINILFGQSDNTGPLRRIITFLRYAKKIFVIPSRPINLLDFIREREEQGWDLSSEAGQAEACSLLRQELIARLEEEKATTVGPVLKSQQDFIKMVMEDESLVQFMDEIAAQRKVPLEAVVKEARKYLKEIASDYSEMFIELWDITLTWLWNNIYDGIIIDEQGLEKIRRVSRMMPFVIVPCHRSHIDYFLLSYVFYQYNIQLPFIAAGSNLMFWPIGYLLRKSGAFFLPRTFRGNRLYAEVFAHYVKVLLREGMPLEFFIEGGRSRTGKMVMPKYGLLAMIIQSYLEKACEDLAIVPVYIGYDKVIEEKAYLEELGGIPKEKEKTTDVLKIGKFLRRRYGRVYLNVGDPIQLRGYLAAQEKPIAEMSITERQALYRKIGYEVVLAINKVSVVTPFSLVASALLSHNRRGISHDDLMDILELLYDYLSYRKVSFAATFMHRERALAEALALFERAEVISKMDTGEDNGKAEGESDEETNDEGSEIVYCLEDDKRLNLEYYKNNILHYFLPLSFVAQSLMASTETMAPLGRIVSDYRFLKHLFWHEFIFDEKHDDAEEVNDVLSYLHARGMITGEERDGQAWLEVKGKGRVSLPAFAGLIHNYIESYWVVIRSCRYLKKVGKTKKDWLKQIRRLGMLMYKKGEITRAEALSQSNYQSAIAYLKEIGILEFTELQDKPEKLYRLAGTRAQIEGLRHKLFKFL